MLVTLRLTRPCLPSGPVRISQLSVRTPKKKEKIARNHIIRNVIMMTLMLYLYDFMATYKDCVTNSLFGGEQNAREKEAIPVQVP